MIDKTQNSLKRRLLVSFTHGFSRVVERRVTHGNRLNGFRFNFARATWLKPGVNEIKYAAVVATLSISLASVLAQAPADPLSEGFKDPPPSARPRTWWHWTASNVTTEGITKDLEWMKRVGIAGFQLADVNAGGGQTVPQKIVFGTPEWLAAVRYAASEADRLGLEMTIFSSPGWSETGGPWIRPEQAMKKLVWSETTIEGPTTFNGQLPQPPTNNGPIRNLMIGSGR